MNSKVDKELATKMVHEEHKTLQETGNAFGVSRERIRQVVGNVHRPPFVRELKENRNGLAHQLYSERSITIDSLAKDTRLSIKSVKSSVGSEVTYWNQFKKRRCTKCDIVKDWSEFFHQGTIIHQPCKKCDKARHDEYYAAHREQLLKYAVDWQRRNKDRVRQYHRTYCSKHRKKMNEKHLKYYHSHREEICAKNRARYCLRKEEKIGEMAA